VLLSSPSSFSIILFPTASHLSPARQRQARIGGGAGLRQPDPARGGGGAKTATRVRGLPRRTGTARSTPTAAAQRGLKIRRWRCLESTGGSGRERRRGWRRPAVVGPARRRSRRGGAGAPRSVNLDLEQGLLLIRLEQGLLSIRLDPNLDLAELQQERQRRREAEQEQRRRRAALPPHGSQPPLQCVCGCARLLGARSFRG
jgi:hypothetical protein